jgi:thiol-disulfide isomerase/thioredoxin
MAKITDIIMNRYWKPYKRTILIVSLLVVFTSIAVYSYFKFAVPKAAKKDTVDITNSNRRIKYAEIKFFSASWCPHCTAAAAPWKSFVNSYDGTIINDYTIQCINIDCSTTDDPLVQEQVQLFGIEKFPSIFLVKDKTVITFDAKITEANLTKFVNSVL